MPKPSEKEMVDSTSTYWKKLRELSAWHLIILMLGLLPKGAEAFELTPDKIKERFYEDRRLMSGLFSYFPSFFIPSPSKKDTYCILLPPEKLCNELFWFLADFYGKDCDATKRVCSQFVKQMFDYLIEAGAQYIDLIKSSSPLHGEKAYGFCSRLGTDILCYGDHFGRESYPNKTTIDFILQNAAAVQDALTENIFSSALLKFIIAGIAILLAWAILHRPQPRPSI